MRHVYVFDRVALVVGPWWEPMDPPERGTRLELRLLAEERRRGSRSAAQRIVVDTPVWRADLFDQVDSAPGNLRSAHFHPRFHGVEPCDRVWPDGLADDPLGWLEGELGDLEGLLDRAGVDAGEWAAADAEALRAAIPGVLAAVEATWAAVRSS